MNRYIIAVLLPCVALFADVSKQTYMKMKMMAGSMEVEQTSTTSIRADRKADDNNTTTRVVIVSAKPQHRTMVTRLDKPACWEIDHNEKTWRELELKLPEYEGKVEYRASAPEDTTQRMRVVKSEFTVTRLAEKKTINAWPCEGYVLKWLLILEEVKTREKSTSIMTTTLWTTTPTEDIRKAQAEEEAFSRALMAKLNANVIPEQTRLMGMEYLMTLGLSGAEVADGLKKAADEMSKVQGYPIVTDIQWEVRGDTTVKPQEKPKSNRGLLSGGLSVGNIMERVVEQKIEEKIESKVQSGVVFSSYLEVKSIKTGPVADQVFEVPPDYRKL